MNKRNLLLVGVSIIKKARDWDAFDIKTLQEEVDDEKAELETRLYVGYIRHVFDYIIYS